MFPNDQILTQQQNYTLPALGGDLNTLTLSGFSSGSFLAANLHVVFSETVKGVALHAGGTYGGNWNYEPANAFEYAKNAEKEGAIDDLENLQSSPVFIHSGSNDHGVPRPFQIAQEKFYKQTHSMTKVYNTDYQHTWPVDRPAETWPVESCAVENPVGKHGSKTNCKDDMAQKMLSYLYESLEEGFKLKERNLDWESMGTLMKYDQHEFVEPKPREDGFTDYGYVYYPNACAETPEKKCKIHVYLHGCYESAEFYPSNDSVLWNGFLGYGASNDIIMVFPQNKASKRVVGDDQQCWSHYPEAIADKNFYSNQGIQQSAFKRLFERLGAPREEQIQ